MGSTEDYKVMKCILILSNHRLRAVLVLLSTLQSQEPQPHFFSSASVLKGQQYPVQLRLAVPINNIPLSVKAVDKGREVNQISENIWKLFFSGNF